MIALTPTVFHSMRKHFTSITLMKQLLLILTFLCAFFTSSYGTTFTVTNTNNSGAGSLRQAIDDANADNTATVANPHIIDATGLPVNSTISVTIDPANSRFFLVITNHMTIKGSGAANLTISGNGTNRIFWIQNGTITLQDLTLADGYARGGGGAGGGMGAGGAIFMHEGKQDPTTATGVLSGSIDLRLLNVTLKNNQAIGGTGGTGAVAGGGLGGNGLSAGGGVLGNGGQSGGSVTNASGTAGFGGETPGTNGGIAIFGLGSNSGLVGSVYTGMRTPPGFGGGGTEAGGFGGGAGVGNKGGFGGGGGTSAVGSGRIGGFGGGNGSYLGGSGGFGGYGGGGAEGGAGAGFGGAIFVASGKLTLQGVTFDGNTATGGSGAGVIGKGKGYGGALFIFDKADNGGTAAPGTTNDPQVVACGVTYTNNSASDDPNSATNNDNLYGTYLSCPTTTSVTSTLNPSFTGNNVTITATVTSGGNPVTLGAVSFFEGAQALATNVSLNASGQASFTKSNWAEGSHLVTANYSGATGFNTSTGTLTQVVNNTTTVTGTTFCNDQSGITINDNAAATPYPSRIFVSGLSGTITSITVDLKGLTHPFPSDIDLLLVSPTGQKFVLMSGVGGTNAVNNANITLSDAAGSGLLSNTLTSGTFQPRSYEANNTFPSPAPANPYNEPAPTGSATLSSGFNGVSPNGTWQLYVVDDVAGNSGWITGGWCLNFTMSCTNSIAYVNASVASSGDGTTWGTAFKTLQEALTAANTCANVTQIWVAQGTYYPTADASGNLAPADARTKTFVMKNNLAIYGGFPNDGTGSMANRNWTINPTILSGEIQQDNDASNNSYNVIRNYSTSLTSTAVLDGFTITGGNAPSSWGGGMLNFESSPSLSNITFSGNSAEFGGGMFNHNSTPSLSNVTFSGNSAEFGGGMFNEASTAGASLSNVTFLGNSATTKGGGMFNTGTSPSLTNCSFLGNVAEEGGGMYNRFSSPSLTNCTFSGNQAPLGGGMYNENNTSPSLKNCILWGNSSEVGNFTNNSPTYTNCLVQGLNPAGTGNLDGTNPANNPLFVSQPPVGLGTTGDLRLQACSPALNKGNDADNSTTFDLAGNDRKFGQIDLGAYEFQAAPFSSSRVYVNQAIGASGDGTTWATAFKTLQEALTAANSCPSVAEIWVAKGTYYPTADATGNLSPTDARAKTFVMKSGVSIYGGFVGNEASDYDLSLRNFVTNETTLSGDLDQDDGANFANNGGNAYHVIYNNGNQLHNNTILDGFTVKGGNANSGFPNSLGGGMFNYGSSPTVSNCWFTGNTASIGGGLSAYYNAAWLGLTPQDNIKISKCTFSNNTASNSGGGMHTFQNQAIIENTTFSKNSANYGGGLSVADCAGGAILSNVVFSENTAGSIGGGIGSYGSNVTVINGTFSNNSVINPVNAATAGGGISHSDDLPGIRLRLLNCILWGNTSAGNINSLSGFSISATNSDVQGISRVGWVNCIDQDPLFLNAADPDGADNLFGTADDGLRLSVCSPAINTGVSSATVSGTVLNTLSTDIVGNARPYVGTASIADMGAYEFQGTLTAAPANVSIINSTCGAGCIVGGGSISAPTGTPCPAGATLQYQVNDGMWSSTLPTYAQTGLAQTIKTRCSCDADPTRFSPESSGVTTIPGTVPALNIPTNGTATVACPALAIQPTTLPVVNDCNGNPITPSGPVITNTPDPLTCEGTRTYTYT